MSEEEEADNPTTLAELGLGIYNKLKNRPKGPSKAAKELTDAQQRNAELKAKLAAKQLEDENRKLEEQLGEGGD